MTKTRAERAAALEAWAETVDPADLRSADTGTSGMQSLDQALLRHVRHGMITPEEAARVANNPDDFRKIALELGGEAYA